MCKNNSIIRLYNADTLDYAGSVILEGSRWSFSEVTDEHLVKTASGLPLKAMLACLIAYNLVYDIDQDG